jgi:DNA-directed RNA polymerase sigma subunit (sigma70/sigma32)
MVSGGRLGLRGVVTPESADALAPPEVALSSLSQAEPTIIVRRYGIDGRPRKLAEIAGELGLSRERVLQLQCRAEDATSRAPRNPAA